MLKSIPCKKKFSHLIRECTNPIKLNLMHNKFDVLEKIRSLHRDMIKFEIPYQIKSLIENLSSDNLNY